MAQKFVYADDMTGKGFLSIFLGRNVVFITFFGFLRDKSLCHRPSPLPALILTSPKGWSVYTYIGV